MVDIHDSVWPYSHTSTSIVICTVPMIPVPDVTSQSTCSYIIQSTQHSDTRAGRALSLRVCSCLDGPSSAPVRLCLQHMRTVVRFCCALCPIFLTVALVCLRERVSVCRAQRRIKPIISSKYGTAGSWRAQGLSTADMSSQNKANKRRRRPRWWNAGLFSDAFDFL